MNDFFLNKISKLKDNIENSEADPPEELEQFLEHKIFQMEGSDLEN